MKSIYARARETGIVIATMVVAVVVGSSISRLSPTIALIVALTAVALLSLVALRRATRSARDSRDDIETGEVWQEPDVVRLGRWFFYAGAVTTGFLIIRPVAGFTISDIFFGIGLILVAGHSIANGRPLLAPFPVPIMIGLVIFLVGASLSSFASPTPVQSLFVSAKFAYLFLGWSWLSREVLHGSRHVEIATRLWLISAAVCASAGILQITAGVVIPGAQNYYGRVSGLTGHVNDLGGVCAMALVVAVASGFSQPSAKWRAIYLLLTTCIAAGLVFSGSVGSMAAAAAGITIWLVTADRLGPITLRIGLVVIAATFIWSVLPLQSIAIKSPLYRLNEVTGRVGESASLNDRTDNYALAWNAIAANPLVGHGLDSVGRLTPDGDPVHNLYLGSFYEAGVFGLVGIVVIIVSLSIWFVINIRSSAIDQRRVFLQLFASFVAFMVFSLSAPTLYQRYGWTPVILFAAASGYQRLATARRTASQPVEETGTRAAVSI